MGSLRFTNDSTGNLGLASEVQRAILEVFDVPDEYDSAEVTAIAAAVYEAGIFDIPRETSPRSLRITWAALVEKGIAAGVLAEQDA